MKRRNESESNCSTQKRINRQKLNIRNDIIQKRDNIIPDTFGLENINQHEIKNVKIPELSDELSNQQINLSCLKVKLI